MRRLHFPRSRCGFPFRRPHAFLLSFRFPSSERRKTAVFAARLLNFPPVFLFPAFSAPLPVAHGVRFPREFPYCQGSVCALPIFVFPPFFPFFVNRTKSPPSADSLLRNRLALFRLFKFSAPFPLVQNRSFPREVPAPAPSVSLPSSFCVVLRIKIPLLSRRVLRR